MTSLTRWSAIATALFVACAPHTAGTSPEPSTGRSKDLSLLRADEIQTVSVVSAYDAVVRLRPSWLRRRGPVSVTQPDAGQVVAYVDGMNVGGVDALARVPVSAVIEMQYLSGSDATTRFGVGHGGGAILVRTR